MLIPCRQGTRENPVTVNDSPEATPRRASTGIPGAWNPPHGFDSPREQRRSSRGEGQGGSFAGWVRSHFGGGT